MPDNKDEKKTVVRTVFEKVASAESILDSIDAMQDRWAKEHPDIAHEKYPTVYDEQGNRIKK